MLCALPSGVSTVLFGGHHPQLLEYDIETGQCVRLLKETDGGCALMRRSSQYVCCGNPNGQVFLRDPTTLNVVTTFDAHSGCLSDFDIHGNQLVTCGFSTRFNFLIPWQLHTCNYDLQIIRLSFNYLYLFPSMRLFNNVFIIILQTQRPHG